MLSLWFYVKNLWKTSYCLPHSDICFLNIAACWHEIDSNESCSVSLLNCTHGVDTLASSSLNSGGKNSRESGDCFLLLYYQTQWVPGQQWMWELIREHHQGPFEHIRWIHPASPSMGRDYFLLCVFECVFLWCLEVTAWQNLWPIQLREVACIWSFHTCTWRGGGAHSTESSQICVMLCGQESNKSWSPPSTTSAEIKKSIWSHL